ncbi:hypothetical protein V8F06_014752 [Rhypophila decipiens]
MRLDVLLALAATASADTLVTMTSGSQGPKGVWFTDFNSYVVDVNNGCRNPGVPNIPNYCMDWVNKRLHFDPVGQNRRCMREVKSQCTSTPNSSTIYTKR